MERSIRKAAVPLDCREASEVIAAVARGRRVVAVGESHHFVHETYELRARVLEALWPLGFRHLGVEMSRTDGFHLDGYVADGDPRALERVGTFGRLGDGDTPYTTGILAAPPDQYPTTALAAEYRRFLNRLRGGAVDGERWSVFGFDIEYHPGAAATRIGATTDPFESELLATSRRYDAAVRAAASYDQLMEPMAWREQVMGQIVGRELAARPATEGAVLAGHNLHVGPRSDRIRMSAGVGPGGGVVPPLGVQLAGNGLDIGCIWMLHDHGDDSGPPPGDGKVRSIRGTLNATLARCGDAFALPTAAVDELAEPWTIASLYGTTIMGIPAELCDLILFVAETTHLEREP